MRVLALLIAAPLVAGQPSFVNEEQQWRADYEASLKAPDGWLAVAGLFWLHEGPNTTGSDPHSDVRLPAGAPAHAGVFRLERGSVIYAPVSGAPITMQPDTSEHPTVVHIGVLALTAIKRSDKTGIRLRDPNAAARRDFKGATWFPPDPSWRVTAKWVAFPEPKKIPILNILDMTTSEICPGYAQWVRDGKVMRLEPVIEDRQLFFMFRDATNGRSTYSAGRFFYADEPADLQKTGQIVLDFNHAHNPPCAFTAYATCPLPPRQNRLAIAVNAGEKMYGRHVE